MYSNGVAGSTSTVCERPLTFKAMVLITAVDYPLTTRGGQGYRRDSTGESRAGQRARFAPPRCDGWGVSAGIWDGSGGMNDDT